MVDDENMNPRLGEDDDQDGEVLTGEELERQLDESDYDREYDNDGELAVDYESLRFIELRGGDSKLPAQKWGGYNQDFDDAEHVHTHEEVEGHPSEEWGVVDCEDFENGSLSLLIFDIDVHKAPEDFDESRLDVPEGTLMTRSQNGGFHAYYKVHFPRGELNEGDFHFAENLPFDIDIRGSAVSHHVVAPADIPGVGGEYEIVNNNPVTAVFEPTAACEGISLDGEPAIEYDERKRVDIDFDRPAEPPEDMPTCYHAGLSLRAAAPDDSNLNTHKVNVLTALCGLAAGYDAEEVASHMCGEYAPQDGDTDLSDQEETEYQVQHIESMLDGGQYSPPALSTLRAAGILDDGESCGEDCEIEMHDTRSQSERDAAETVAEFTAEFDPVEDRPEKPDIPPTSSDRELSESEEEDLAEWPSGSDVKAVRDAIPRLTDEDYEAVNEPLVARMEGKTCTMFESHRTLTHKLWGARSNIVNYNGELVTVNGDRWATCSTILNFELDVTSLLSVQGEDRMANVEVRPAEPTESAFEMQVEPRVFNDSRRFKDEILGKRFSTTIESDLHESDVMDMLRKYISRQDVPQLVGQKSMGLAPSGDEFVTPNGVIGVDGWVDEPDTVFVEQDAAAERKFEATPDDHDTDEIVNGDVAAILELFTRTRDLERFIPVLGWWFAAPHRDRIVDTSGSMNLMFITGESGVGKSGTLKVLNRLFGLEEAPFSASDTKFAQIKTFSSSNGVPVWLDEYKTSEMADWQQSNLHELLRKVATGGVEQRGRADQSTVEYQLKAPVCVSGETSLRGSAEQRRSISTTFTNRPTESGAPEYQRFKELAGDAVTDEDGNVTFPDANYEFKQHAVKYYQHVAEMSADEFEQAWFGAREYVSAKLVEWDTELDDLEVQGLQTVAFGFRVMREFADEMGADLSELPGEDDLEAALKYIADVEGDGRETHIDQFTMLVQRAAVGEYLEKGTHYDVVREGKPGEELRVNVNRAFDAVSKYLRDHDLSEDLLGNAKDYNDRFGEAEEQDTYVATTSQGTPGVGRAVGIHTGRAEDEIGSFNRAVFVDDGDGDDGYDAVNDDSDPDGPTPLIDLGTDADYAHITAKVVEWGATPDAVVDAGGPVESGSVADVTHRRAIVAFDYDTGSKPEGIEHMEEGATVRIKNAPVGEYNDCVQINLDAGTTITPIQQGVGYTEGEEPDDGQATMTDSARKAQDAVRADGGDSESDGPEYDTDFVGSESTRSQADRVTSVEDIVGEVEDNHEDGAPVEKVIDACEDAGFDQGKVEHELEKLKRKGKVYEPSAGRLRTT
ncbi:hypothetical protein OB955_03735 [Halobacteria archaeon AArc-m2/3/4]|uniref:MCM C-terminal domain-containing protein n=1 Tax=Natronoglomus mannanivorans TaxID=2979990 RepID=A0ABT2QAA2_9EURY|nr:hypothetical protein [Halobacteria archaeon AArc-m2/3/4]